MTILHVTDFHFNKRWFDWLLHRAPVHDLVVMSGDMLDLTLATPQRRQIEWVSDWLNEFPRPISVCSGYHDREWDPEANRWTPAYWLREIVNPLVWTDGQRVELDGLSILNIGATTRPKGGEATIWVVHAGPTRTVVSACARGGDGGDPDLAASVDRYAPRLVLSGHVHDPLHWQHRDERTLFLNPGRNAHVPAPNHILVWTESMNCEFVGFLRDEIRTAEPPAAVTSGADSVIAAAAVA